MAISHAGSRGFTGIPASDSASISLRGLYQQIWSNVPAERLALAFLDRHQPEYLTIATNNHCNLACPHCYLQTDDRDPPLSFREWEQFFGSFFLTELSPRKICFAGREPLLDAMAVDVGFLLRSAAPESQIGLVTNGTLLNRWYLELENLDIDFLDVSLDGSTKIHDRIRGRGTFSKILRNISNLPDTLRSRLSILCSINSMNFDDVKEFLQELEVCGIRKVVFGFFQKTLSTPQDLSISKWQAGRFFDLLLECLQEKDDRWQILLDVDFLVPAVLAAAASRGWLQPEVIQVDETGDAFVDLNDRSLPSLFIRCAFVSSNLWHAIRISADGLLMGSDDSLEPTRYDRDAFASIRKLGDSSVTSNAARARCGTRNRDALISSIEASRECLL
ncbi:MAG: radical SAM protein [Verrucomicrobia bacterium]|jgi:hypothetical protein|nr:radical SAM protein [Verrucomicrobiota bacterium]